MENAIKKLICEYEDKISNCDIMLNSLSNRKVRLRRDQSRKQTENQEEMLSIKIDRIKIDAQRQAYVQAMHDIMSLDGEI